MPLCCPTCRPKYFCVASLTTQRPPDATAAPDPEVTWQVAFFALVPLALGCMTQPVGRVFGAPAELRFWMRANPLVCAGDVLHYFLAVLITYTVEPCWSWRHFRRALADRFCDIDWSAPPPKFENAAVGRWTLIALGGIPCQTVKLMAMRGIPATQSLTLTYAVALVFGEALNLSAEACLRNEGAGGAPAASSSSHSPLSPTKQELLSAYARFLLHVLQALPVWWLSKNIAATAERMSFLDTTDATHLFFMASLLVTIVFLLFFSFDPDDAGLSIYTALCTTSFPFLLLFLRFLQLALTMADHLSLYGVQALSICFGFACVFACWLGWITLRRLGRSRLGQALGVPRSSPELRCLVLFLVLLLLVVLSYFFTFDGTGTANPPWLARFG